jgi:hypothetical protein
VDVVETTKDTSSKLGAEGVPDTVLDLLLLASGVNTGDADALLAVHALTGGEVASDEEVLLALGNVDTLVLVGLDRHGAGTLAAETGLAATATAATTATTGTTGTTASTACKSVSYEPFLNPSIHSRLEDTHHDHQHRRGHQSHHGHQPHHRGHRHHRHGRRRDHRIHRDHRHDRRRVRLARRMPC